MRLVSIVGDSISTYAGYNPQEYKIYYDEEMQKKNSLCSVYDTWWAKVNKALSGYLCVNNSYSGSRVSGTGFPAASCDERIKNLQTNLYLPDIILIYIGFNDFGYGVKVVQRGLKIPGRKSMLTFSEAYEQMLVRIQQLYPEARIVCGTLMRTKIKNHEGWIFPECYAGVAFESYNVAIRRVCKKLRCCCADIASLNIPYETLDGSHPTKDGHITIARAWIKRLEELGVIEPSAETCIRIYNANKDSDIALYMVFSSLAKEKVLMAISENDNIAGLSINNQEFIPIFTSPEKAEAEHPIQLRVVALRNNIDLLINLKRSLIVNPFSEPDIQFIIPYDAINIMLKTCSDTEKSNIDPCLQRWLRNAPGWR